MIIDIDKSKLKRDYIINPLKFNKTRCEKPFKEDLEYLYLELNMSVSDLLSYFNKTNRGLIEKWLKEYNIHKSSDLKVKARQRTKFNKYGDENYNNRNEFIKTCQQKYAVNNVFQSDVIKEKSKQTKIKKYGNEKYINMNKIKEIKLSKYGDINYNNVNKRKQTNLIKFGTVSNSQTQEFKNLWKNKEWANIIKQKIYNTKKRNNTFNSSKSEQESFQLVQRYFPNAISQYYSEKYPFNCDIYIPETDLYIELNYHWTHGYNQSNFHCHCPFDSKNSEHLQCLKFLQEKNSPFYNIAINVWTVRDVTKRNWAKEHNLNWIEFFTQDEFNKWFEQYSKIHK